MLGVSAAPRWGRVCASPVCDVLPAPLTVACTRPLPPPPPLAVHPSAFPRPSHGPAGARLAVGSHRVARPAAPLRPLPCHPQAGQACRARAPAHPRGTLPIASSPGLTRRHARTHTRSHRVASPGVSHTPCPFASLPPRPRTVLRGRRVRRRQGAPPSSSPHRTGHAALPSVTRPHGPSSSTPHLLLPPASGIMSR